MHKFPYHWSGRLWDFCISWEQRFFHWVPWTWQFFARKVELIYIRCNTAGGMFCIKPLYMLYCLDLEIKITLIWESLGLLDCVVSVPRWWTPLCFLNHFIISFNFTTTCESWTMMMKQVVLIVSSWLQVRYTLLVQTSFFPIEVTFCFLLVTNTRTKKKKKFLPFCQRRVFNSARNICAATSKPNCTPHEPDRSSSIKRDHRNIRFEHHWNLRVRAHPVPATNPDVTHGPCLVCALDSYRVSSCLHMKDQIKSIYKFF